MITDKGYENLADFLPTKLEDIEHLVGKNGVLKVVPPTQEGK